ncbi:MAG TPA: hypothetical protein VFN22_11610 [Gemmatimonadales bacterium]|nr:hypothetical protein [Gemmatimonadales bacterium]
MRPRYLAPLLAVILAVYTLRVLGTWHAWHLPDYINLPVHETGHLVFNWGGEVVTALGGTILQLLMPATFAVAFHRRADRLGTGLMIWWAGESAINVARYVADARAQLLPLVGGGEHDWTFLLTTWNVIDQEQEIAVAIRTLGAALMILGTWWVVGRTPSARLDSPASSARLDSRA